MNINYEHFPVGDKPIICISPTGNDFVVCGVSIDIYSLREKEKNNLFRINAV